MFGFPHLSCMSHHYITHFSYVIYFFIVWLYFFVCSLTEVLAICDLVRPIMGSLAIASISFVVICTFLSIKEKKKKNVWEMSNLVLGRRYFISHTAYVLISWYKKFWTKIDQNWEFPGCFFHTKVLEQNWRELVIFGLLGYVKMIPTPLLLTFCWNFV